MLKQQRRSQLARRDETKAAVLASACRLFAEHGYAATSLEAIAFDCGGSVRPIYHYFGSKKALFSAVNDVMEARNLALIQTPPRNTAQTSVLGPAWNAFLDLLLEPGFRQIVLVDAPVILGRERWADSAVTKAALKLLQQRLVESGVKDNGQQRLLARMLAASLAEAAQYISESDEPSKTRLQCEASIERMLTSLLMPLVGD